MPAAQLPLHDGDVRPVLEPYLPAAQSSQSLELSCSLAVPASDRYLPLEHEMQSNAASLPVALVYLPAAQTVHDDAPPVLYVPAGQLEHVPPPSPSVPAAHAREQGLVYAK